MLGTLQRRFAATVAGHGDRVAVETAECAVTWSALAGEADRAAHERHAALVHDAQNDAAARAVSEAAGGCRLLTAEALAERAAAAPERPPPVTDPAPDRPCNVIHTSGTTGTPKGAALRTRRSCCRACSTAWRWGSIVAALA